MALDQHLGDAGAASEVAVNLKRGMGIEHVGIGSDFDGDGGVPGCNDASEMLNLTRHLLRQHFNADDLRLLWGENFLRLMKQVQAAGI